MYNHLLQNPPQNHYLAQELQKMKDMIQGIQSGQTKKTFRYEYICPYLFDQSILAIPFPKDYEIPKFYKYKGKGNPIKHLKEFRVACQEVAYNDIYLMRLTP